jgi:hypothetical protein
VKVVCTVEHTGAEDAGVLDRTPDTNGVRSEAEGILTPIPALRRECATNPRYGKEITQVKSCSTGENISRFYITRIKFIRQLRVCIPVTQRNSSIYLGYSSILRQIGPLLGDE